MALSVIYRDPEGEALAAAMIGEQVTLLNPRRKARRFVKLYRDNDGRPYIVNRYRRRQYLKAIAFTCIDGQPLSCGAAVLEEAAETRKAGRK